jgi:hypothetical protein
MQNSFCPKGCSFFALEYMLVQNEINDSKAGRDREQIKGTIVQRLSTFGFFFISFTK